MFGFYFHMCERSPCFCMQIFFPLSLSDTFLSVTLSVPFLPFALFCSAWLCLEAVWILCLVSRPFLFLPQSGPRSDAAFPPLGLSPRSFIIGFFVLLFLGGCSAFLCLLFLGTSEKIVKFLYSASCGLYQEEIETTIGKDRWLFKKDLVVQLTDYFKKGSQFRVVRYSG